MGALSKRLRSIGRDATVTGVAFWCPGCDGAHLVHTDPGHWTWNGKTEQPTFTPSLLITSPGYCCHTITTDGRIQFCGDCTHALAGQTVDMIDWPAAHDDYGGVEKMEATV